MTVLLIVAVLLLVLVNGFFVAAEFSLVRASRARLDEQAKAGVKGAAAAARQQDDLSQYLSACQFGITLASLGIGFLGEPAIVFVMKNIGTGEGSENGAAVKDVVMQVITAMASSAANSGKLPAELQGLLNVNVNQMVTGLTAEARKRIAEALPGEAGRIASEILADPNALLKNPGAVVGAQAEQLKGQAQAEAEKRIGGALERIGIGGGTTQPSTQPATQPADRAKQEAQKAINQGIGGLLNRDKKEKDRKPNR